MGDAEEPVCVEDEEDGFLWAQVASGTATPESAERWLAPDTIAMVAACHR